MTATVAELAQDEGRAVVFPGRLRLFVAPALRQALPEALPVEWPALDDERLAAVAGAAGMAEANRQGRVLLVLDAAAVLAAASAEALTVGARLAGPETTLVVAGGGEGALARAAALGWGRTSGPGLRPAAPVARQSVLRRTHLPQEWPPVRLPSLPVGVLPDWPTLGDSPGERVAARLAWLAEREPRMLLGHHVVDGPASAALALALAQLASDGRRVVWLLPSGSSLTDLVPALAIIGRRRLGLKLISAAPVSPALATLLEHWWIATPADDAETAAVLAAQLDQEDPCLLALPPTLAVPGIIPWPSNEPWIPGSGRWLIRGGPATVICGPGTAANVQAAQALLLAKGLSISVYHATSLTPCCGYEVRQLPGPVLVVDDHPAGQGLDRLLAEVLPERHLCLGGDPRRGAPDAVRIAAAMCALAG